MITALCLLMVKPLAGGCKSLNNFLKNNNVSYPYPLLNDGDIKNPNYISKKFILEHQIIVILSEILFQTIFYQRS